MTADPESRLRADARRNRDQILAAARTIFAAQGAEVPMEEIARAAGVGVGTLYRRFPDRDALIRAVAVDNFDRVLADAKTAKDQESTYWEALVRLLHQSMELQLSVQLAMVSPRALAIMQSDPAIKALRDDLLVVLDRFVVGAQQEGMLRLDVATGDIAILFATMLRQMPGKAEEIAKMATTRCIGIMVDGLRVGQNSPLPGRALTSSDLE